jgi:hypothetical protein
MVTKIVNQPLGMGNCFAPSRKEWVATAIGAGVGLASSIFGGAMSALSAKEARKELERARNKEQAWYNRRYYEDYLDTNAGNNLVTRAKRMYDSAVRKAQGAKAVGGGTDASVAIAKEQANDAAGKTIANLGALDAQRKFQIDMQHQHAQERFAQQEYANKMQDAQNITNAAQAASNAAMSIGSAVDQASTRSANLNGGSNNSTPVQSTSNGSPKATNYTVNSAGNYEFANQADYDAWLKAQATGGGV